MGRTTGALENRWRVVGAVLAMVLVVAVGPAVAGTVGPTDSSVAGSVVVGEGETVDELNAVGGQVVIEGTVTGDVSAVAGEIRVDGTVEGDVASAAGSVVIDGDVGGEVASGAGSVTITETGSVDGGLSVGAGTVTIDGTVGGTAAIGADSITLGDDAAVAGDLTYAGSLAGNTDAVAGEIDQETPVGPEIGPLAEWLFAVYAVLLNLVLGALLLGFFPRFSAGVADRVVETPVRTALVGLGVLLGIPLVLVLLLITVLGIPLSLVGAFGFALLVWVGIVYGRFAVAAWLLGLVDVRNRWLALVVGLVGGAVLAQVPFVGPPINLLILLIGLGALARGLVGVRRAGLMPPGGEPAASSGPASD